MILLTCPHCGQPGSVPDDAPGSLVRCSRCSRDLTVPPANPSPLIVSVTPVPAALKRFSTVTVVICLCLALGCCAGGPLAFFVGYPYLRSSVLRPTYTRTELEVAVAGLTTTELRRKLGSPDKVEAPYIVSELDEGNEGYWMYKKLTYEPPGKHLDEVTYIWIRRGRVSHVSY